MPDHDTQPNALELDEDYDDGDGRQTDDGDRSDRFIWKDPSDVTWLDTDEDGNIKWPQR